MKQLLRWRIFYLYSVHHKNEQVIYVFDCPQLIFVVDCLAQSDLYGIPRNNIYFLFWKKQFTKMSLRIISFAKYLHV
jgi:hypothetical protein